MQLFWIDLLQCGIVSATKLRQLLQSVTNLMQRGAGITKYEGFTLLQTGTRAIAKWSSNLL